MAGTRFAMVSEWMVNGNINEFVESHPDADRLGLVGFTFEGLPSGVLTKVVISSWSTSTTVCVLTPRCL